MAIGGSIHATRPVDESYGLIRVPGVSGVRGYLSNQEVGRTDRRGDLLVPNLLPYYGNRLGINDKDIPMDHDIGTTELTIAPPFRGGPEAECKGDRGTSRPGSSVKSLVSPQLSATTIVKTA